MPQAPLDTRWTGAPGAADIAALDGAVEEFSTDADRVYLTGLSLGGNGTWYLAYTYPDPLPRWRRSAASSVALPGESRRS